MEEDAWEKAKVFLILILIGLLFAGSKKDAVTLEQFNELEYLYRCKEISADYFYKAAAAYQNNEPMPSITTYDRIKKGIEKELFHHKDSISESDRKITQ